MTETHFIKLPKRSGKLEVIEEPTRIVMKIRFDKYGDFGDLDEVKKWLWPIMEKYEADPRPMIMDNPMTGERVTVMGDASNFVALIEPPRRSR